MHDDVQPLWARLPLTAGIGLIGYGLLVLIGFAPGASTKPSAGR